MRCDLQTAIQCLLRPEGEGSLRALLLTFCRPLAALLLHCWLSPPPAALQRTASGPQLLPLTWAKQES